MKKLHFIVIVSILVISSISLVSCGCWECYQQDIRVMGVKNGDTILSQYIFRADYFDTAFYYQSLGYQPYVVTYGWSGVNWPELECGEHKRKLYKELDKKYFKCM